jgi:hypothetical protein
MDRIESPECGAVNTVGGRQGTLFRLHELHPGFRKAT